MMSLLASAPPAPAPPTIRYVKVEGNSRIPALSILSQVSAKPNSPFDPAKSQQDVKKLHDAGLFENVQVSSRDAGEGKIDLIYFVREYPFISSFSIEGVDAKLEDQIRTALQKEKLELVPATPFRPSSANKTAMAVRDFLRSRKHPNADVKVITQKQGNGLRVLLQVDPGQRLEVGSVKFAGNESIPESELLKQMQHSRPAPFWSRWAGAACYISDELASDLQRLRIYYRSKGFAEATVGEPRVQAFATGGKQHIEIDIPVVEGSRYRLTSLGIEGNIRSGAAEINKLVASVPPSICCISENLCLSSWMAEPPNPTCSSTSLALIFSAVPSHWDCRFSTGTQISMWRASCRDRKISFQCCSGAAPVQGCREPTR
jgi:outer membrane protein insertion porin family